MGSALLDTTPGTDLAARSGSPAAVYSSADALRMQVAERLAAHRSRRRSSQPARRDLQGELPIPGNARAAHIAATVAERYARSPSYRAFLAAEAERAIHQAQAATEVAALNAQAVAAAQQNLLDAFDRDALSSAAVGKNSVAEPRNEVQNAIYAEAQQECGRELTLWPDAAAAVAETGEAHASPKATRKRGARESERSPGEASVTAEPAPSSAIGLTVRLYEEAGIPAQLGSPLPSGNLARRKQHEDRYDPEALALDDEIAFRHDPVFEEPAEPPMPLPANLIEFPRQLIASRKARPRYAEGPLREESPDPPEAQLRIFEVDPAQISTTPEAVDTPAAQWTSIWLDAPGKPEAARGTEAAREAAAVASAAGTSEEAHNAVVALPQCAGIGRRVLASAINGAIVILGLLAFAGAFLMTSGRLMLGRSFWTHLTPARLVAPLAHTGLQPGMIAIACAVAGGFLYLLYQALFFSFSGATPGMRCARIALCTFDGGNPTRSAMRRRMLATLLSVSPLGLGFFWATLDEERLTWHDRICRVYPRRY